MQSVAAAEDPALGEDGTREADLRDLLLFLYIQFYKGKGKGMSTGMRSRRSFPSPVHRSSTTATPPSPQRRAAVRAHGRRMNCRRRDGGGCGLAPCPLRAWPLHAG